MSNLEEVATTWLNLFKAHSKLFMLEAKLAKRSIAPLVINGVIFLVVCSSFWFMIVVTIGYVIYFYTFNIMLSVLLDLLFTAIATLVVLCFLLKYLNRMQFKATQKHISFYKAKENADD